MLREHEIALSKLKDAIALMLLCFLLWGLWCVGYIQPILLSILQTIYVVACAVVGSLSDWRATLLLIVVVTLLWCTIGPRRRGNL